MKKTERIGYVFERCLQMIYNSIDSLVFSLFGVVISIFFIIKYICYFIYGCLIILIS